MRHCGQRCRGSCPARCRAGTATARARREPVVELDRRVDHLDDVIGSVALRPPAAPRARSSLMSWMSPTRSSRQRGVTRMPVRMRASSPASTACSSAVSAPSSRTSAQANGRSSGCFSAGGCTHAHVVTSPAGPTSTRSSASSASPVSGSYSVGGQMHPAVRGADAEEPAVAQAGDEAADDRADGARVRVLEDVGGFEDVRLGHGQMRTRSRGASQTAVHSVRMPLQPDPRDDLRLHGPGRGPARARKHGSSTRSKRLIDLDRAPRRRARRPRRAGAAGRRRGGARRPARAAAEPAAKGGLAAPDGDAGCAARAQRDQRPGQPAGAAGAVARPTATSSAAGRPTPPPTRARSATSTAASSPRRSTT